jgi:hypothetical protein
MARKSIPKIVRFEVFKRDKFTCQYCGASAPEVILEVDHIKPVSKGGTDDIMNLVTACRDCNRGKTNRELSDDSAVKIQKQRLDDMQERREQLKMMMEWREELEYEIEAEIDSIDAIFQNRTKWGMSDVGKINMRKIITRFGYNDAYEATDIAINQYYDGSEKSWQNAFSKIGGICYNRKKAREENAEQDT